ncbi:hypothetical protein SPFM20_00084 [Salmonella phage SPFM20]|nr:hypothetical protein SPFM20_00084 [Salmonella phage SPFM20]
MVFLEGVYFGNLWSKPPRLTVVLMGIFMSRATPAFWGLVRSMARRKPGRLKFWAVVVMHVLHCG